MTPKEKLRAIRELVEHALEIDGEHHKQADLYEISEIIGIDIEVYNKGVPS